MLVSFTGASKSSIVGGRVAKPHSRPYMASLQFNRKHSCGGILIREDFVLTAAHCKYPQSMTVVLGAHNITLKEKSQQWLQVAEYIPHPKFTGQCDYDFMLLRLMNNATLNRYVQTIVLPQEEEKVHANVKCAVAGWGKTGTQANLSNLLKETTERIQFNFECKNVWQKYFDAVHMICTKFDRKEGGICQGDSGGPLICNNEAHGITACTFESDCNNPRYPHIFTKVNIFLPWIKKVMQRLGNVA